ncbi:hypothetical protein [Parafrankia discariae]|uniref:hypothetical protein n=1 Tax=Parafrankia discariae TaxID=365528 RepID=UPI00036D2D3F|nr:hypothetical protein [Parafrankia discariae]
MSVLLAELAVGVPLAVVAGLVPTAAERAVYPVAVRWRPGSAGVPFGLWLRLVRRCWRPGRRLRTLAAPLVVLLYVAAGVLRAAAVAVRLADLGTERAARRADEFADDPMFPLYSLPPSDS